MVKRSSLLLLCLKASSVFSKDSLSFILRLNSVVENTILPLKHTYSPIVNLRVFKISLFLALFICLQSCKKPEVKEYSCPGYQYLDTLNLYLEYPSDLNIVKQAESQIVILHYLNNYADSMVWSDGSSMSTKVLTDDVYSLKQFWKGETKDNKYFERDLQFSVETCDDCLMFPEIVTANWDGINDRFQPIGNYCSYQLKVEGKLGIAPDTKQANWEQEVPEGDYFYFCKVQFETGKTKSFTGSFVLIQDSF